MKITPVINEFDFSVILKKFKKIKAHFNWVQFDVSDGVFVKRKTLSNAEEFERLLKEAGEKILPENIEIHLMAKRPENQIDKWAKIGRIKRIIIHIEAIKDKDKFLDALEKYKNTGKQIGLAINPETDISELRRYFDKINFFLIVGVSEGFSGLEMNKNTFEKIKSLKEERPNSIIGVDGGVNAETAPLIKKAGADIAYSSSYLFNSEDIEKAVEELEL